MTLFSSMFGLNGLESNMVAAAGGTKALAILAGAMSIVFFAPNLWQYRLKLSVPLGLATSMMFVLCVLRFDAESPFLYFQF
jgi:hypothetical protein